MSKYYKAEDVIRKRAEDLADTSYWEYGNPKNVDDWIEVAEMEFKALPTIEVSEEDLKGCDKVDKRFSEDCISKAYLEQEIENHLLSTENLRTEKDEWWNKAFEVMVEIIEDAPSVVPKWCIGEVDCPYVIDQDCGLQKCSGELGMEEQYKNCPLRRKG